MLKMLAMATVALSVATTAEAAPAQWKCTAIGLQPPTSPIAPSRQMKFSGTGAQRAAAAAQAMQACQSQPGLTAGSCRSSTCKHL